MYIINFISNFFIVFIYISRKAFAQFDLRTAASLPEAHEDMLSYHRTHKSLLSALENERPPSRMDAPAPPAAAGAFCCFWIQLCLLGRAISIDWIIPPRVDVCSLFSQTDNRKSPPPSPPPTPPLAPAAPAPLAPATTLDCWWPDRCSALPHQQQQVAAATAPRRCRRAHTQSAAPACCCSCRRRTRHRRRPPPQTAQLMTGLRGAEAAAGAHGQQHLPSSPREGVGGEVEGQEEGGRRGGLNNVCMFVSISHSSVDVQSDAT